MKTHQVDVFEDLSKEAAGILAYILISAQGINTPVSVMVVTPTTEHRLLIK